MTSEFANGPLTAQPGFLLSRVGTVVQSGFKDVVTRWGMRPLHFMLLTGIGAGAGSSQQELCRALGIDSGNMVELIDKLEELGYATRTRSSEDRRRQVLKISRKGRAALARITADVAAFEVDFFEPLSHDELMELATLLARLYVSTAEGQGAGYIGTTPPNEDPQ